MTSSAPVPDPLDALDARKAGADGSFGLLASLFLILITFFVVLNSISNQHLGKAGRAVESVNTAFDGGAGKPYLPKVDVVDLLADKERDVHHDLFYEQGAGMMQALLDFPGKYAARGGNVLQVELASRILFEKGAVNPRADQTRFLNAMADLLRKELSGEERSVEIMIAVRPSVFRDVRAGENIGIRRAAAFARELEDRGVPGRSITTGLVSDKRDLVWLTFTSRDHRRMDRDRLGAPGE